MTSNTYHKLGYNRISEPTEFGYYHVNLLCVNLDVNLHNVIMHTSEDAFVYFLHDLNQAYDLKGIQIDFDTYSQYPTQLDDAKELLAEAVNAWDSARKYYGISIVQNSSTGYELKVVLEDVLQKLFFNVKNFKVIFYNTDSSTSEF